MKHLFLIMLLVLKWWTGLCGVVKIGEPVDGMTGYYEPDTLRKKGQWRKIWVLFDFATPQSAKGLTYKYCINCVGQAA